MALPYTCRGAPLFYIFLRIAQVDFSPFFVYHRSFTFFEISIRKQQSDGRLVSCYSSVIPDNSKAFTAHFCITGLFIRDPGREHSLTTT